MTRFVLPGEDVLVTIHPEAAAGQVQATLTLDGEPVLLRAQFQPHALPNCLSNDLQISSDVLHSDIVPAGGCAAFQAHAEPVGYRTRRRSALTAASALPPAGGLGAG